ncbi:ABC1 kinase family protein [Roseofilum casamattae]|uniref:AarF/UbiB family protein n=1 Tax=Roseofilum casamattae BLCC-M143 TaxID=3022442 RepID=A0ABT7BWI0_9CYAN|nr:AarF/UbiB family protein [Roseofilum casamattae]MDJ1183555.1 AarF/UbiB family protein [Roseofilum casamattae BLCC-M143]
MVKRKDIPTQLIESKKKKKVKVVPELESRRFSIYYVVRRFIFYFIKVQLRRLTGRSDPQKTADQLREIFEEFGGFWVKAGQVLALRTDLFPPLVCDELRRLQYEALGFPTEVVRRTIEEELGKPVEQVFTYFDDEPLAAASIGQIHRAVLQDAETPVVVKVQRPGIKESFERDLNLIKVFVDLLVRFNIASFLRLDEAITELEKTFKEELDYRYEASNTRRMRKSLKAHKIYVPKIYDDYSRQRILVMEFIDGVLMSDYIKVADSDPDKVRRWEEENNVDTEKLGESLFLSLYRQIFEDNLYHGDLHPGNIILLRNTKFALIDMGSIGRLDKDLRVKYLNYINGLAEEDYAKASDYYIRFALDIPRVNMPRVRAEMAQGIEVWASKARLKGVDYQEKSFGGATTEVSKVQIKYGTPSNWILLKITRSFLTLDGSLQYIVPDFDIFKLIDKYKRQADRRAFRKSLEPKMIRASLNQIVTTIDEYNSILLPEIRQRTTPFELTADSYALALAAICRSFAYGISLLVIPVLYTFLYQYYFQIVKPIDNAIFDDFVSQIMVLPYLAWVMILIVMLLTIRMLFECVSILERKEYGFFP